MTPEKNDATVLLRLPADLKAALLREAAKNGRRITAEINIRLGDSLVSPAPSAPSAKGTAYSKAPPVRALTTGEVSDQDDLTNADAAMLRVFRAMPPEKQLALLSLFK